MTPPKKIYLELNTIPPCNFGALWYDAEVYVPMGENCAAYVLESDAQAEIEKLRSRIATLEQKEAARIPTEGILLVTESAMWLKR